MSSILKILAFLSLSLNITLAFAYELPDMGEHSATVFTPQQAEKLGKEFWQQVRANIPLITDPITTDYIQKLGQRLVAASSGKNRSFHFFVVNDESINSFAGPAGYVGIFSGIILASRTESELAAVMAHEISHVTQHHIERMFEQAQGSQIPAIAAMVAAIAIGATSKSSSMTGLTEGAAMATMAGSAQNAINFTRSEEAEADSIGMRTLAKAGFNPNAAVTSFEHIQQISYDYNKDYPSYLSDHPETNARIADAKNRMQFYAPSNYKSSPTFYLVRERLRALQFRESFRAVNYFKTQLNRKKQSNIDAIQYGSAVALLNDRQFDAAKNVINRLIKKNPKEIMFQLTAAAIQKQSNDTKTALLTLNHALVTQPNYYPLMVQYAETLIVNHEEQIAIDFLRDKLLQFPDKIGLYILLADAEAKVGHLADAYQARAKAYELDGLSHQAIILLQQARKLPNLSFNDQEIIDAKLVRLKKIERNQKIEN